MSKITVLILAVASLAVSVAPSSAATRHPNPIELAARNAARFWGHVPCGGSVAVHFATLSIGVLGEANATNLFAEPDDSYQPALAATLNGCEVLLARQLEKGTEQRNQWDVLCVVMTHEYGHLLGYGHTTDVRNVMTPGETVRNEPSACKRYRPRAS